MIDYQIYKECIDVCLNCAVVCNHCASACLKEDDIMMMSNCIQLDMECSVICFSTAQTMSFGGRKIAELLKICADICEKCGEECAIHQNKHCQECAKVCKDCAEKCRRMAA